MVVATQDPGLQGLLYFLEIKCICQASTGGYQSVQEDAAAQYQINAFPQRLASFAKQTQRHSVRVSWDGTL